jgi:hypothetical protein
VTWTNDDSSTDSTVSTPAFFDFSTPTVANGGITEKDTCIAVTDNFNGAGAVTLTGSPACTSGLQFKYARTIPVPATGCQSYPNTAGFTTNNTDTTGSSNTVTVKVCRDPAQTGALSKGFWQNKNGQGIITGQSHAVTCPSATWLRGFKPFMDLSATASCSQTATYVSGVINGSNAAGTSMNSMLKAQMLATALDVYFSAPAGPNGGGNQIHAPAPVGPVVIDLTVVCAPINGTSCGGFINTSSAFTSNHETVMQLLMDASNASTMASGTNPLASPWYLQMKPLQELAKDTFDAIVNQVAFSI